MGESRRKRQGALVTGDGHASQPEVVATLGGRMHVRWDAGATATPHGQLVYFAEFLAATGVFERWVSTCPLAYSSGNAPDKRDVLGTLMLGLLAGHRRYAHITALRGDAVAAQALGMNKVIREGALRRALGRIDEATSTAWMRPALMPSVREALDRPWVLDIDASIDTALVHIWRAECADQASRITPRERELLQCLAAGWSNQEIAARTGRSISTVRNQLHHLMGKFSASNRLDLISKASEVGLLNEGLGHVPGENT